MQNMCSCSLTQVAPIIQYLAVMGSSALPHIAGVMAFGIVLTVVMNVTVLQVI